MADLRPCPNPECAKSLPTVSGWESPPEWNGLCRTCDTESATASTPEEAARLWNALPRRADMNTLDRMAEKEALWKSEDREEIERLRAELEDVKAMARDDGEDRDRWIDSADRLAEENARLRGLLVRARRHLMAYESPDPLEQALVAELVGVHAVSRPSLDDLAHIDFTGGEDHADYVRDLRGDE